MIDFENITKQEFVALLVDLYSEAQRADVENGSMKISVREDRLDSWSILLKRGFLAKNTPYWNDKESRYDVEYELSEEIKILVTLSVL